MTLTPLQQPLWSRTSASLQQPEPRFGQDRTSLPDIRSAWKNPEVRSLIEGFIQNGLLRKDPDLACRFLAQLETLSQTRFSNQQRYQKLHDFLQVENRQAFTASQHTDEMARTQRRVNQILALVPPDKAPASFVDVGCGTGLITAALAEVWQLPPDKVFGVEVFSRSRAPHAYTQIGITQGRIPLPDNSQDLASLMMVLHHEKQPDPLLREVYRILKHGGYLLVRESDVSTPAYRRFNDLMDHFYYQVFNNYDGVPTPANYHSADAWERKFMQAGFVVRQRFTPEADNPFTPVHFVLEKPTSPVDLSMRTFSRPASRG